VKTIGNKLLHLAQNVKDSILKTLSGQYIYFGSVFLPYNKNFSNSLFLLNRFS